MDNDLHHSGGHPSGRCMVHVSVFEFVNVRVLVCLKEV